MNNSTVATIIANANKAKATVINDALTSGDLKALALAIRPQGGFARVSCPSSMEFGDRDIEYHGRRIAGIADAHEIDRNLLMVTVGRLSRRIQAGAGPELRELQTKRQGLQARASIHGEHTRRIDGIIAVLKEELALREESREAHKARVAAERAAKAAAVVTTTVAVIEPVETTTALLPASWLKKPVHVKKPAQKRSEIRIDSFETLKEILS